jgi:hypothetical protein
MPRTQQELDAALDRQHTFAVEISPAAPLPQNRPVYDPIRQLPVTGFRFTMRELLHAIGSKTAALPMNQYDECMRVSLWYESIMDFDAPNLYFFHHPDSDFVTPISQGIGIGMMCLLIYGLFNVPWDQLGSLPGPGLRFDYRARRNGFDGLSPKAHGTEENKTNKLKVALKKNRRTMREANNLMLS